MIQKNGSLFLGCFCWVAMMVKGFTLLESLLYLTLTVAVMGLCMHIVSAFYQYAYAPLDTSFANIQTIIAFDALKRDVHNALSIKYKGAEVLILSDGLVDFGWSVEQDMLVRREGVFNRQTKRWRTCIKSIVLKNVLSASFSVGAKDKFGGIKCTLTQKNKACFTNFIALRKGIIL